MDHQPAALAAHVGQHGPVHPHNSEEVGIELLLRLLRSKGFVQADVADAPIIDQDIDSSGFPDNPGLKESRQTRWPHRDGTGKS